MCCKISSCSYVQLNNYIQESANRLIRLIEETPGPSEPSDRIARFIGSLKESAYPTAVKEQLINITAASGNVAERVEKVIQGRYPHISLNRNSVLRSFSNASPPAHSGGAAAGSGSAIGSIASTDHPLYRKILTMAEAAELAPAQIKHIRCATIEGRTFIFVGTTHANRNEERLTDRLVNETRAGECLLFVEGPHGQVIKDRVFGLEDGRMSTLCGLVNRCVTATGIRPEELKASAGGATGVAYYCDQSFVSFIHEISQSPFMREIFGEASNTPSCVPFLTVIADAFRKPSTTAEKVEAIRERFDLAQYQTLLKTMATYASTRVGLDERELSIVQAVVADPSNPTLVDAFLEEINDKKRDPIHAQSIAEGLRSYPAKVMVVEVGFDHIDGHIRELTRLLRPSSP